MAIEPAGIIRILENIDANTNMQDTMARIFSQLPTCIQRAVATLQCAQLEKEYKGQVLKLQQLHGFDLPQWMRDRTQQIITRQR